MRAPVVKPLLKAQPNVTLIKGGPGSGPRPGRRKPLDDLNQQLKKLLGNRSAMVSAVRRLFPTLSVQEGDGDEPIEVWDHARDSHAPEFAIDVSTGRVT